MSEPDICIERSGAIESLRFMRPASLNALTSAMVDALLVYFMELQHRPDVRAVVMTGEGDHFCSGLDLKQQMPVLTEGPSYAMNFMADFGEIVIRMRRCPQPVIGLLKGSVVGAGLALALACDIRIAADNLRVSTAFTRLGLSGSEMGISFFLPRIVGAGLASELMYTSRTMTADETRQSGLVSQVVDLNVLEQAGDRITAQLLSAGPLGLRLTKEAINCALGAASLETVIAIENRNQSLAFLSRMPAEGVAAFRERRMPEFKTF